MRSVNLHVLCATENQENDAHACGLLPMLQFHCTLRYHAVSVRCLLRQDAFRAFKDARTRRMQAPRPYWPEPLTCPHLLGVVLAPKSPAHSAPPGEDPGLAPAPAAAHTAKLPKDVPGASVPGAPAHTPGALLVQEGVPPPAPGGQPRNDAPRAPARGACALAPRALLAREGVPPLAPCGQPRKDTTRAPAQSAPTHTPGALLAQEAVPPLAPGGQPPKDAPRAPAPGAPARMPGALLAQEARPPLAPCVQPPKGAPGAPAPGAPALTLDALLEQEGVPPRAPGAQLAAGTMGSRFFEAQAAAKRPSKRPRVDQPEAGGADGRLLQAPLAGLESGRPAAGLELGRPAVGGPSPEPGDARSTHAAPRGPRPDDAARMRAPAPLPDSQHAQPAHAATGLVRTAGLARDAQTRSAGTASLSLEGITPKLPGVPQPAARAVSAPPEVAPLRLPPAQALSELQQQAGQTAPEALLRSAGSAPARAQGFTFGFAPALRLVPEPAAPAPPGDPRMAPVQQPHPALAEQAAPRAPPAARAEERELGEAGVGASAQVASGAAAHGRAHPSSRASSRWDVPPGADAPPPKRLRTEAPPAAGPARAAAGERPAGVDRGNANRREPQRPSEQRPAGGMAGASAAAPLPAGLCKDASFFTGLAALRGKLALHSSTSAAGAGAAAAAARSAGPAAGQGFSLGAGCAALRSVAAAQELPGHMGPPVKHAHHGAGAMGGAHPSGPAQVRIAAWGGMRDGVPVAREAARPPADPRIQPHADPPARLPADPRMRPHADPPARLLADSRMRPHADPPARLPAGPRLAVLASPSLACANAQHGRPPQQAPAPPANSALCCPPSWPSACKKARLRRQSPPAAPD